MCIRAVPVAAAVGMSVRAAAPRCGRRKREDGAAPASSYAAPQLCSEALSAHSASIETVS